MKLPYFKIGEAFNEAKDSFSFGSKSDKLTYSAKLVGKSLANMGMFVVEAGVEAVKRAPEAAGRVAQENLDKRSHLMTDEQIERSRTVVKNANKAKEHRLERERDVARKKANGG